MWGLVRMTRLASWGDTDGSCLQGQIPGHVELSASCGGSLTFHSWMFVPQSHESSHCHITHCELNIWACILIFNSGKGERWQVEMGGGHRRMIHSLTERPTQDGLLCASSLLSPLGTPSISSQTKSKQKGQHSPQAPWEGWHPRVLTERGPNHDRGC